MIYKHTFKVAILTTALTFFAVIFFGCYITSFMAVFRFPIHTDNLEVVDSIAVYNFDFNYKGDTLGNDGDYYYPNDNITKVYNIGFYLPMINHGVESESIKIYAGPVGGTEDYADITKLDLVFKSPNILPGDSIILNWNGSMPHVMNQNSLAGLIKTEKLNFYIVNYHLIQDSLLFIFTASGEHEY